MVMWCPPCFHGDVERPTGYEEKDVFVFQSRYNEANKEIKKVKGMKVSLYVLYISASLFISLIAPSTFSCCHK